MTATILTGSLSVDDLSMIDAFIENIATKDTMPVFKKNRFRNLPVILAPSIKPKFCLIPVILPSRKRISSGIKYPLPEDLSGKIIDDLYLEKLIGIGSNGVLFQALDVIDGNTYAIKVMIPSKEVRKTFDDEIAAYQYISYYPNCNEYIVCIYDDGIYSGTYHRKITFSREFKRKFRRHGVTKDKEITPVSGEYLYLKMEFMDMDLFTFTNYIDEQDQNWKKEHPEVMMYIILELLRALEALHSLKVAHLDIKLENILIKIVGKETPCAFFENPSPENIQVKLGDLGFTCTDKKYRSTSNMALCRPQGTPATTAPEIIQKYHEASSKYLSLEEAQKADIWSMGITIGEFLFSMSSFKIPEAAEAYREDGDKDKFIDAFNEFIKGEDVLIFDFNNEVMTDVFYEMLNYYPEDRPSISEILEVLHE